MTADLLYRATAFIRSIADRCANCFRRSQDNCRECPAHWAKQLLNEITIESAQSKAKVDYSLHARIIKILAILTQAGKPIHSKAIKIKTCSCQLKMWTLKNMIKHSLIQRCPDDNGFYRYTTTSKGKKYYEDYIARTSKCKED